MTNGILARPGAQPLAVHCCRYFLTLKFHTMPEVKLNHYQQAIVKATKCKPEDAAEIEDLMRGVIFHSTLDWQTKAQFNNGARQAKELLDYMRSDEDRERG